MEGLHEISQKLLVRSQEAILQLDLYIQRQQRLYEYETLDQPDNGLLTKLQEYQTCLAQLNSLHIRSEHLRDRIASTDHRASQDGDSIGHLVTEFQKITTKLNELAATQDRAYQSPGSQSTKSVSSFEPKPLKILERTKLQHPTSPTKRVATPPKKIAPLRKNPPFDKKVMFSGHSKSTSLPGSPSMAASSPVSIQQERFPRHAKSCDAGLNKQQRRRQDSDNRLNFFKENQRLSISFFDDEIDYSSDEDTVISVSPPETTSFKGFPKAEPLRRYNSHESVLSRKEVLPAASPARAGWFSLWAGRNNKPKPMAESVSINDKPVYSTAALLRSHSKTTETSKDLLAQFVSAAPKQKKQTTSWFGPAEEPKRSIFSGWKLFNNSVLVTSETGLQGSNSKPSAKRIGAVAPAKRVPLGQRKTHLPSSSLIMGPNGSRFVSPPNEPVLNNKVSYDALHEALCTEFRF